MLFNLFSMGMVATPWWLWLVAATADLGAAVQVWPVQQVLQAWKLSNLSSHRWEIFSDFQRQPCIPEDVSWEVFACKTMYDSLK